MRKIWAAAGLGALALAVSACGSSSSSSSAAGTPAAGASSPAASAPASSASANTVLSMTINGTQVLTDSKGLTLYWFVPDTSTKSNCNGSCATYWPPVKGPVTAGSGEGQRPQPVRRCVARDDRIRCHPSGQHQHQQRRRVLIPARRPEHAVRDVTEPAGHRPRPADQHDRAGQTGKSPMRSSQRFWASAKARQAPRYRR